MFWADRPESSYEDISPRRGVEAERRTGAGSALDPRRAAPGRGARSRYFTRSTARAELPHGERALEALDHPPAPVDDERPRLGRQAPGRDRRPEALLDVVAAVDLLLDERHALAALGAHLLGDVDDRAARARRAQRGRGEQQHDGLLADDVGEVGVEHLARRRDARRQLRQIAADVGGGLRVDPDRGVADVGRTVVLADRKGGSRIGDDEPAVETHEPDRDVRPARSVDDLGDVERVAAGEIRGGLLAAVPRVDLERLPARGERPAQVAAVGPGRVDGDLGDVDLLVRPIDDHEAEPVSPDALPAEARDVEDRSLRQVRDELAHRLALRRREVRGGGDRWLARRRRRAAVVRTTACGERHDRRQQRQKEADHGRRL
ncbi:MAG: hypothetical protein KY433_09465 [Actinobacteria bacterium]|nr:hypothetical protein [Actinomycetota bacterium]